MNENRNWKGVFFTFWGAQAVSLFGSGMASFALIWWLTESTGSATVLATAALAGMLPSVIISPLAGALVDRWNRRWVMIISDSISAIMAALLVALFWSGQIQVWHIYLISAIRGTAGSFQFPAVASSTSLMVPKEQLARVAGLNQTLQGLTNIATPPLGALLLSLMPIHLILGIDVITAIIAVGLLFLIHIPQPVRAKAGEVHSASTVWQDMVAGLRYIRQWPELITILTMATVLNMVLNPAFSLLPILVTRTFNGDALQLAGINTAYGVGFLAGGMLLSIWGGFRRRMYTSMMGLAGMGIGSLVMGLAPAYWFAVAGIVIFALMNPLTNGPFFAILQAIVAPEMQGRVFTVMSSITMGLSPLGLVIAGPLADRFGVQVWYVIGGIICMLMALSMALMPSLLKLEEGKEKVHAIIVNSQQP